MNSPLEIKWSKKRPFSCRFTHIGFTRLYQLLEALSQPPAGQNHPAMMLAYSVIDSALPKIKTRLMVPCSEYSYTFSAPLALAILAVGTSEDLDELEHYWLLQALVERFDRRRM